MPVCFFYFLSFLLFFFYNFLFTGHGYLSSLDINANSPLKHEVSIFLSLSSKLHCLRFSTSITLVSFFLSEEMVQTVFTTSRCLRGTKTSVRVDKVSAARLCSKTVSSKYSGEQTPNRYTAVYTKGNVSCSIRPKNWTVSCTKFLCKLFHVPSSLTEWNSLLVHLTSERKNEIRIYRKDIECNRYWYQYSLTISPGFVEILFPWSKNPMCLFWYGLSISF